MKIVVVILAIVVILFAWLHYQQRAEIDMLKENVSFYTYKTNAYMSLVFGQLQNSVSVIEAFHGDPEKHVAIIVGAINNINKTAFLSGIPSESDTLANLPIKFELATDTTQKGE